jgi:hypothetical protein
MEKNLLSTKLYEGDTFHKHWTQLDTERCQLSFYASWMHLVFTDQMKCVTIMQLVAAGEDNEKDKHNLETVTSVPKTVLLLNQLHHYVMCTALEDVRNRTF